MLSDAPPARERAAQSRRTGKDRPVRADGLDSGAVFSDLHAVGTLLLAVSGGPDSIALLVLAARWACGFGAAAPSIFVATVDHGLRAEARAEAVLVAETAAALGLHNLTLVWEGPKPATRIQERARAARYALLSEYARQVGARHVLTAHHADDQAETIMLRLGRGSGVSGLAGMRRVSSLVPGVTLVRPLLDVPKADLVAYCRREGLAVVDDPSNRDPAFARAALRSKAGLLAGLGLDTPGLRRFGRRMARADAALEAEAQRVEAVLGPTRTNDAYRADLGVLGVIPFDIMLRLLRRAIVHVAHAGGEAGAIASPAPPVRLERLERLTESILSALAERRPFGATLAGARVVLDIRGRLSVRREGMRRRGRASTPS